MHLDEFLVFLDLDDLLDLLELLDPFDPFDFLDLLDVLDLLDFLGLEALLELLDLEDFLILLVFVVHVELEVVDLSDFSVSFSWFSLTCGVCSSIMFLWLGSCAVGDPCDGVECGLMHRLSGLMTMFGDNLFWFSTGVFSALML